jgi:ferredoxin
MPVKHLANKVRRDKELCSQCGACIPLCPTGALYVKNRDTMEVVFDGEKCTGCALCIDACPFKAMQKLL